MRAWRLAVVVCALVWMGGIAPAQDAASAEKDLSALLARMQKARKENWKLMQQYTSEETRHSRNYDKNGKLTSEHTTKFENIALEGLLYHRMVERDGKPLSGKEAADEQKRFDEAVAQRRAMKQGRGLGLLSRTYTSDMPTTHLLTLFDNHVLRTEARGGRGTVVVESAPKPDAKPKDRGEKSALDWKQTTWIDVQDAMPARIEVELLWDRKMMKKGTVFGLDFTRRVDEPAADGRPERVVWLETAQQFKGAFKMYWFTGSSESETAWTNFKKFQVDMRLLEETMQEVPTAQQPEP